MLPASLAAMVPVFMARPTSACASAGASLVPSPVIATRRPPACSFLIRSILSLRRGLRQKIVHAGFGGDGRCGQRVVAGDHDGADAHGAQLLEALAHAALHHVLQMHHAQRATAIGHHQRRAARAGNAVGDFGQLAAGLAAVLRHEFHHRFGGALAHLAAVDIHAAHARLRRKRNEVGFVLGHFAPADVVASAWPARRSSGPPASRRPGWKAAPRRPVRPPSPRRAE